MRHGFRIIQDDRHSEKGSPVCRQSGMPRVGQQMLLPQHNAVTEDFYSADLTYACRNRKVLSCLPQIHERLHADENMIYIIGCLYVLRYPEYNSILKSDCASYGGSLCCTSNMCHKEVI